jgi:hypothetical protein
MDTSFGASWHTLLENVEDLPSDAILSTPLSGKPFGVKGVQEHRIRIEYRDGNKTIPLQREQFETLFQRVEEGRGSFDLDRLPPDAEPYATVLSLHPRFELDYSDGTLIESDTATGPPLVDTDKLGREGGDRTEPDISVYADALLLIDALERHDPTELEELDTQVLANLYTLLSDVQRSVDDLRQEVRAILLDRLHSDQPVSGQFGRCNALPAGTYPSKTNKRFSNHWKGKELLESV